MEKVDFRLDTVKERILKVVLRQPTQNIIQRNKGYDIHLIGISDEKNGENGGQVVFEV